MNNEINFKSWETPRLTERDKREILQRLQRGPEKANFYRFAPQFAAVILIFVVALGTFLYRERSLGHELAEVGELLRKEVSLYRRYDYFSMNERTEHLEREVFYEERIVR